MKKAISILLAAVLLAAVFAGCSKENKKAEVAANSAMENIQTMVEYAEQLEKEGNTDAAAQVWALIPDAAERAAKADAQNAIESNSKMQTYGTMDKAGDIVSAMQGEKEE